MMGGTNDATPAVKSLQAVTILAGADEFGKNQALTSLREAFFHGGQEGDEVVLDGNGVDPDLLGRQMLEELRTRPLSGGRKLVVIRQADGFAREKRDLLLHYLEAPVDFSRLVLVVLNLGSGANPLRDRLKRSEAYLVFDRPRDTVAPWERGHSQNDTELNRWVAARARQLGLRLKPGIAAAITDRIGNNRAELEGLLSRWVMMHGPEAEIGPDAVEILSGRHREVDVFSLVDSIMERNTVGVLKNLTGMFSEGLLMGQTRLAAPREMFVPLTSILFKRIRQTAQLRCRLESGESVSQAAEALGIRSFLVARAVNEARRFSGAELRYSIDRLLDADRRFKYEGQSPETLLVDLVLDVMRGRELTLRSIV